MIVSICLNKENSFSGGTSCKHLLTAATLSLCKLMCVSRQFCEENLRLLFTILQKSVFPSIRSNIIISIGDLCFRFPNLVEPWSSHLYDRLQDKNQSVRKNTLMVLTHLILNDMIKMKGQIGQMVFKKKIDSIHTFYIFLILKIFKKKIKK